MINTLREEILVIISLIIFGIYISFNYDIITLLTKRIQKRIIKVIIELLLWSLQIYLSYRYSYKIHNGYIPIYFLLFIIVGVLIYLMCRRKTVLIISKIISFFKRVLNMLWKEIKKFIVPRYIIIVHQTLYKQRKSKRNKDIEIWKG